MTNKIAYLHRTQAKMAEGEHIRGMISGFRNAGYEVDVTGPPGIHVLPEQKTHDPPHPPGNVSWKKRILNLIADDMPQILFEAAEFGFNGYGHYRLNSLLKKEKYEFIYERYALNTFYSIRLAEKYQIPVILEVNDATVIERSRPLILKKISGSIEKRLFDRATMLITISEYFKRLIIEKHQIHPDRIIVTPNAVNPKRFTLDRSNLISKNSIGIKSKFVIGCVGAFVPWHGLEFMVNSLCQLLEKYDIHILLVGDGPVRKNVQDLAEKFQIADRLLFTGFVDAEKVPYFIDLMDICLIPGSNDHCSPVKLFEYMAMGKPTILPKYKPLSDTIDHGAEGLFFEPHHSDDFQRCVIKLITDEQLRSSMGETAKHTVYSKYTWDNNVKKVLTALKKFNNGKSCSTNISVDSTACQCNR